ncbi:TolC family protein [Oleiharenicola sp. Vm1]|uniref:TolC family protein n=1 Tax=Oleiharenicola sp. Vm1 TaxID=3398393 RepID=UPI0039F46A61
MLTSRRFFALLLSLASLATATAQTAPAGAPAQPGAVREKLTLDEAIRRAVAKNYTIQSDAIDVSIARAKVLEQFGLFDPQLNGKYTYSENENPLQTFDAITGLRNYTRDKTDAYTLSLDGTMPWGLTYSLGATQTNARGTFNLFADTYDTFGGVSARQPLLRGFGFGTTTAQIRIAMAGRDISEWAFRASVINTVTNVIFAYYDLNFAQANLRTAIRFRDLAASLLEENQKRFKVGAMSDYDVTSARARVAMREENILVAQRLVHDAENALKALISDERTPRLLDWSIEIEPMATLPVAVVNPALDFQEALKKRPDYQQARLNLKRSDINYKYQRNQLLPRVDLVGSYGYNGLDANRETAQRMVRNEDFRSFSYGVQVTIPLTFTGERGRYRQAKFAKRQAEIDLEQVEQGIVVSVGNAANNIEVTRQRVEAARKARELAQDVLEAEQKRLRAGSSSTFFVSQEQEIVASLEVSELRAESDYRRAIAEYDRQLGVTLEKLNISVGAPK